MEKLMLAKINEAKVNFYLRFATKMRSSTLISYH